MKPIIIHNHIFKNAGSSVDQVLQNSFPDHWRQLEGPFPWSSVSSKQLLQFLAQSPDCRALSSHQARFMRPGIVDDLRIFPIVFLRNPIDRVGSCFSYDRSHQADNSPTTIAAQQGLAYYIDFCLGEAGRLNANLICNYQVLHLSNAFDGLQDTRQVVAEPDHLDHAICELNSLPAFGLVEEFRLSARLLNRWIRPWVPAFFMSSPVKNASGRFGTLHSRIDGMRHEIGERRFERLLESNQLDIQLFSYAQIKFHSLVDAYEEVNSSAAAMI